MSGRTRCWCTRSEGAEAAEFVGAPPRGRGHRGSTEETATARRPTDRADRSRRAPRCDGHPAGAMAQSSPALRVLRSSPARPNAGPGR
eukprot:CAMPEP_0113822648 /NCGR_PEP_ID=MMETSP0328-20130328/2347_1 /TAXON_ID=39455 /ORGANISM="Alexandrium minutum" /LENGTH=87 /DNA_ID=CAMNT_0000790587 /DNA_START=123 /DNA_END=386 /DNA_ORIENTATION=+ /assembly_acc=CAM_ASM_000350